MASPTTPVIFGRTGAVCAGIDALESTITEQAAMTDAHVQEINLSDMLGIVRNRVSCVY